MSNNDEPSADSAIFEMIAHRHRLVREMCVLSPLKVRGITESDLDAIKDLDGRVFGPSEQYDNQMYGRLLSDPGFQTYVAIDENDALVGYALLDVSLEPARLRSLAVHPDHQRVGCAGHCAHKRGAEGLHRSGRSLRRAG